MSRSVYVELVQCQNYVECILAGRFYAKYIWFMTDCLFLRAKFNILSFFLRWFSLDMFPGFHEYNFIFSQRVHTIWKFERKFVINDMSGWVIYNTEERRGEGWGSLPRIWRQIINLKRSFHGILKKENGKYIDLMCKL